MLVVTDNGVQVLLKQKPTPKVILQDILVIAVLFAINGILGFGLHLYSTGITILFSIIIIIFSASLHSYRKRNQPKKLSGGNLLLSSKAFSHTNFGKTIQYQLTQNDTIKTHGDSLKICNNQGKTLYQINGFNEPRHLQIAEAVLQGKTIATQAKAIKMQSSSS